MSSEHSTAELAIYLKHISKKYPIYDRPSQKLFELLTLRRKQFHHEFWALRDVDLEVSKGITLGIVGQNGSGKSTLLQIVAGILRQTKGECLVSGNVSALLELGSGFNPEFTGRENVFMNGAILGLTHRQIEERIDQILDFSEIGGVWVIEGTDKLIADSKDDKIHIDYDFLGKCTKYEKKEFISLRKKGVS